MGSRRDRVLAAALALVAVLIVLLSSPASQQTDDPRPSSLLPTDGGVKALYLMLEELDVPAERGLAPWARGVPAASALALIAPTFPLGDEELDALMAWVEEGGTLLYVASPDDPMLDALGLESPVAVGPSLASTVGPSSASAAVMAHRWTVGVDTVHGFERVFPDTSDTAAPSGAPGASDASNASDSPSAFTEGIATPLLRLADGRIAAAVLRRGEGTVIAWSDVAPLRNAALRTSGAALILARAAAEATTDGNPLVFDEYHHGFRGDGHAATATLRFLRDRPAGHMALQLLAAVLALLLLAGWRFGAPLAPVPAERRSPLEHVDALAELYRQANARDTTRRLLLAQLARRLRRRPPPEPRAGWTGTGGTATGAGGTGTGTPSGATPADDPLDRILTGIRADSATIEAVRTEWRRGRRADLATLSRAMDRLVNEVKKS